MVRKPARRRLINGTADIRVVTIEGNPWFVAADVCRVLGTYMNARGQANSAMAVLLVRDDEKCLRPIEARHKRAAWFINESGLYKLVMRSDKPDAKPFQDWVTRVVLPAIRKDGNQHQHPRPVTRAADHSTFTIGNRPMAKTANKTELTRDELQAQLEALDKQDTVAQRDAEIATLKEEIAKLVRDRNASDQKIAELTGILRDIHKSLKPYSVTLDNPSGSGLSRLSRVHTPRPRPVVTQRAPEETAQNDAKGPRLENYFPALEGESDPGTEE